MQTGSIVRKLAAAAVFLICSAGIVSALAAPVEKLRGNEQHRGVPEDFNPTETTGYISQHQD